MDDLVKALGPAFAAGFALQRLLDILDPIANMITEDTKPKKALLAVVSLAVGFVLAAAVGLRVLKPLGIEDQNIADVAVTALVISAGTEGFNSILKFLGYAKEDKKAEAAGQRKNVGPDELGAL